ncbi:hypothetical protein Pcinc_026760 [Petrolisthes cinctipes]|uniref:Renin receptor n=1 Tax=Petrolisthes cinctipes TaxID=88211 RepID=A0AAE1F5U6_PETCI|nr:hypothetical protein Pcinc_026760 [Petrolisthes cinctipes]
MARVDMTRLLLLLSLFSSALCGEITMTHSPDTLRFGTSGLLRSTDLDDLLAASLGYTPIQSSLWRGLTITSPFNSPSGVVVVEVHGGGANVRQEGATYGLKEDTTLEEVFHRLKSIYGARAQRHTIFKHFSVGSSMEEEDAQYVLPEASVLNMSKEADSAFLHEMAALTVAARKTEALTTTPHGGQDVFFLEVDSLEQLVKTYGLESPQVEEAINILRVHLVKVTDMMRQRYNDQVLVVTAIVDQDNLLSRRTRSVLQSEATVDVGRNKEYSEDYPAIFNIILWLSITLFLAVLATSIAMATMDPGRDSIIYRMTTMRMKKDN